MEIVILVRVTGINGILMNVLLAFYFRIANVASKYE